MNTDFKTIMVLTFLAVLYILLAASFRMNLWGNPDLPPKISIVDPKFTNPATVRVSAAELIRQGGDVSALDCTSCHDLNKPGKIEFDAAGVVVLPGGHQDLVMRHGRNHRNENCFNCHNEANYALLKGQGGRMIKIEESTQLCARCHGPTYRDWEVGIHGHTSGYWNRELGPITRRDCADCHNLHSPAFSQIKPAPGQHSLHGETHSNNKKEGD